MPGGLPEITKQNARDMGAHVELAKLLTSCDISNGPDALDGQSEGKRGGAKISGSATEM